MKVDLGTAKQIFLEALRLETESQIRDYLDSACAHDFATRQQVEALLAAHHQGGSLFDERLFVEPTIASAPQELAGERIGHYKLRELLGTGGMGSVYVADQERPVRRRVALKVIKAGMDSRQVIARFQAERQALALMDHPHIAKVFDAGTSEQGRPYFVMELVRGVPITEFCDAKKLPTAERLALFIKVCQAVQHAHQKGVIHRDIKPSNVLVTLHDDIAVPKVIDFGIAKVTGAQPGDQSIYTAFAQMVGTPLYMSPEQAELNALDVDTRSDVYSLGVLLYELITGTTPFDQETLRRAGFDEMRRIIREVDPPKPSDRVTTLRAQNRTTVATSRSIEVEKLDRALKGELDWIVMKALDKNRTRRYDSPNLLAVDIQHYLDDEPVTARPSSPVYRARKFVARHRPAIAVTALTVALIATVSLFFGVNYFQQRSSRFARQASVDEALRAARSWINEQKLDEAEKRIAHAQALLKGGPVREDTAADVAGLAKEVQQRRIGQERLNRFLKLTSEAADSMFMGSRRLDALKTIRDALSIFQVLEQEDWHLGLDTYFLTISEKEQLKDAAYIAIVNLADSLVRWKDNNGDQIELAEESRALLDKAEKFHQPTRAYHFVKAAVLAKLGMHEDERYQNQLFEESAATYAWDHFLPGHTAGWKGNSDVAIREYEAALEIQRDHFNSMYFLANRLFLSDLAPNLERAEGLLTGCLAMRPDNVVAFRTRFVCRYTMENYLGAERDLLSILKLQPEAKKREPRVRLFLLYCKTGQREKRQGITKQLGGLRGVVDASIAELGHSPAQARASMVYNLIGDASYDPDDVADAIKVAHEATELSPEYWESWDCLGLAQYRAGEWEAAVKSLEKSERLLPLPHDDYCAATQFCLAMAYSKLNQPEIARCCFERGLGHPSDPNNKPRSPGEQRLFERSKREAEIALGIANREPNSVN